MATGIGRWPLGQLEIMACGCHCERQTGCGPRNFTLGPASDAIADIRLLERTAQVLVHVSTYVLNCIVSAVLTHHFSMTMH